MVKGYKQLDVWKKAMMLTNAVYDITATFPKEEIYGLSQQLRRCAVSIPSNIAEGSQRGGTPEFIHFLTIAHGSLAEVETQLLIALHRKYITQIQHDEVAQLADDIGRMLNRLIQSLKQKQATSRSTKHEARNTL